MRATYPNKAIASVHFAPFGQSLHLKVYKKCSDMRGVGLENHLYHTKDHGRIHKVAVCDTCSEIVEGDDIVSMTTIGDELITVSKEQVKAMWEAGDIMRLTSCPSVSEFSASIVSGKICINTPYEIFPAEVFDEFHWKRILTSLNVNDQCMNVTVPINAQLRRAIILPSGLMYTLYFESEIREDRPAHQKSHKISKNEVADISKRIDSKKRAISKVIPKVTPERVQAALLSD